MTASARRVILAAWAVLCLGPRLLGAQDAPFRPSLDQLRSSLDTAHTVAQVEQVASAWSSPGNRTLARLACAYV